MVTEPELLKSIINNNSNNEFQTGEFSGEAEEFDQLLTLIKSKLKNYINEGTNNSEACPAITPIDKRELSKVLNLNLTKKGEGHEGVDKLVDNVLKYSVNGWTPNYCDKLCSSTTPIGVMSELILGALNATAHVYHVSPCLIQMELAAGRELTNLLGYSGPSRGGLTFPGGSQSNFMAISLARNLKFPSIKINGFDGEKLAIFTPQQGHYSIDKAAISLGVGLKRVYKVPCNIDGSMIPEQLELMIQQSIRNGEQPFFVNSSAGSTVLGAFDDFGKISQICKKYDLWYHIDGSWGGSIIFSKTHRHLLNNAELSDSFTVNPHKLLGVPVQCSYLLLQDRFLLNQAHTLNADYLFHNNDTTTNSATSPDSLDPDSWLYSNMDLADGTVGCGRRPDGFKMFLTWKYVGTEGFTKRVDHALSCAQFFQHKIQQHPNFKLLVPATSLNVCFYYLPSCRDQGLFDETVLTTDSEIPQIPEHYSYITKDIIEMMKEEGKIMIDYSPLKVYNELTGNYETIPHFFRMVFNHPKTSEASISNLINEINRFGHELME